MWAQRIDNTDRSESKERHKIGWTTRRALGTAQRYCGRRDTRIHISSADVDLCGDGKHRLSWMSWGTGACSRDHVMIQEACSRGEE